jgi:hypothetical protein
MGPYSLSLDEQSSFESYGSSFRTKPGQICYFGSGGREGHLHSPDNQPLCLFRPAHSHQNADLRIAIKELCDAQE